MISLKKIIIQVCLILGFIGSCIPSCLSCSALIFNRDSAPVIAINVDWRSREGVIVLHPRHLEKQTIIDSRFNHPVSWTSQYGSIIFHGGNSKHIGPGADGINEMGLTASILILKASKYPEDSDKPTLASADWVTYLLDNFSNVKEVIEHSNELQLTATDYEDAPLNFHLMVNDASGNSAILEYLEGQLIIHQKNQITQPVLTNGIYENDIATLTNYKEFGGSNPLPGEYQSEYRFARAAAFIHRLKKDIPFDEKIAYAFHGLSDVSQPPQTAIPTEISIVLDTASLQVYFRTINSPWIRNIRLKDIDFDQLNNTKVLDAFAPLSGNVLPYFKVADIDKSIFTH